MMAFYITTIMSGGLKLSDNDCATLCVPVCVSAYVHVHFFVLIQNKKLCVLSMVHYIKDIKFSASQTMKAIDLPYNITS